MWELSTDQGARYITEWSEVEPLLDRLDNKLHAYISLALEDGTRYIEIYGGNQNRVLVAFTDETDDEDEVVLYDESQTEPITIYSMPDNEPWEDLPPSSCIDKSLAKRALRHFFDTHDPLPDGDWRAWPDEE
jgi:hypothetical protein